MSTDATTTADGFRVGRRVKCRDEALGEGVILGKCKDPGCWDVQFDSQPFWFCAAETVLDLLPEPDAPATPEPPADSKPSHYQALRDAGCEPFAVIRGAYSRDWAIGHHACTALTYLLRCQHKHDSPDDDIRKAHAHLAEAVAILDSKPTT